RVQNNAFFGGGLTPGRTLVQETGEFRTALEKQFAYGGSLSTFHAWNYLGSNAPGQLFPTSYTGTLGAEYRHPLLAGAGPEFTRIAGPIANAFGGLTGVNQGVVIARINADITLADFEAAVRNLVLETEDLYWNLYLAYRLYDTAVVARNSALESWRKAKDTLDVGGAPGFTRSQEAQARDQYFFTRTQAEQALAALYETETSLRRMLGMPVNDGTILRPVDEPTSTMLVLDWHVSLAEALTNRVELRRQKFNVKSLELQLQAAKSLTQPRLDFVSNYRVNAFGDSLLGQNDNDGVTPQGLASAYETLTQGNQTGWNLGFEMTMNVGLRSAHAQVRNLELRLAKARGVLATQELEIAHELAVAFQDLAEQYQTAETSFNRRPAAVERVRLATAELDAGTATFDDVLRAQSALAEAERAYFTSLIEYNKAVSEAYYRKGLLLERNNIHLAEGEWTPAAYIDALRRAWARSHAHENPHLHAEPSDFVIPDPIEIAPLDAVPVAPGAELLPSPDTVPPAPGEAMPSEDALPPDASRELPTPEDEAVPAPVPRTPPETGGEPGSIRESQDFAPAGPMLRPTLSPQTTDATQSRFANSPIQPTVFFDETEPPAADGESLELDPQRDLVFPPKAKPASQ
ncbi:MAG: TolC family protein, partial [Planctomycetes bacterium]|nr:TolC family protein [Planctomycetota bacterium]